MLAKEYPYYDGIDADKGFIFGTIDDEDGFPEIGKGSDASPFVLGVTTLGLLTKIHKFRSEDHFKLFHTDATFKLSDLGYPVITGGFTDQSRTYHLAAILIISARTHKEYELAFRSVASIYHRIFRERLRVDAVLGDAEDVQLNALQRLLEFSDSTYLMCFFHVLYNVHKRTRHLATDAGVAVFTGIMDMHYTTSYTDFCTVRDRVISSWRSEQTLSAFADYLENEWVSSRFWCWQIYYTSSSYATTNNPREVFNASVKRHVQRKASEICALLRSMIVLAEDVGCDVSNPTASIAPPNVELKQTAKWMIKTRAIAVVATSKETQLRVLHLLEIHIDDDLLDTMRRLASSAIAVNEDESSITAFVLQKTEKAKPARLYRDSVKWSIRRAHRQGMPKDGWLVDVDVNMCGCPIHVKFGICAHIVAERSVLGVGGDIGVADKLMCRRARKKQRTRCNFEAEHALISLDPSPFVTTSGSETGISNSVRAVYDDAHVPTSELSFGESSLVIYNYSTISQGNHSRLHCNNVRYSSAPVGYGVHHLTGVNLHDVPNVYDIPTAVVYLHFDCNVSRTPGWIVFREHRSLVPPQRVPSARIMDAWC